VLSLYIHYSTLDKPHILWFYGLVIYHWLKWPFRKRERTGAVPVKSGAVGVRRDSIVPLLNHLAASMRQITSKLDIMIVVTEEARKAGHRAEERLSRQAHAEKSAPGNGHDFVPIDGPPAEEGAEATSPSVPLFLTDEQAAEWVRGG